MDKAKNNSDGLGIQYVYLEPMDDYLMKKVLKYFQVSTNLS